MPLPTQKTKIKTELGDYKILLYGSSKIGKTSMCANFPGALFLATEPGHDALSIYSKTIDRWDINKDDKKDKGDTAFIPTCREIMQGGHGFKTIIVDTVDNLYKFCDEYICKEKKIAHPSDLGFGKGFAAVNTEFHRLVNRLALLPYGLVFISHSVDKEVETRTGKIKKSVPSLSPGPRDIILKLVDIILYIDMEAVKNEEGKIVSYKRVIRTKPTLIYEAGDRTGRLKETIDLDYNKLVEAFNSNGEVTNV